MHVAKWGNSLAVRIPADVARALGLKEGDGIELHALDKGKIAVISEQQRREEAIARLKQLRWSVPEDYKFDREEANSG